MRIGLLFRFVIFHMLIFTFFRMIFFFSFEVADSYSLAQFCRAMFLGFRFDLRLVLILVTPLLLFAWGKFNPFENRKALKRWPRFYFFVAAAWLFVYISDWGHFSYLRSRINSTLLLTFDAPEIALGMVWESYPVVWISIGFILALFVYLHFLRRFVFVHHRTPYVVVSNSLSYVLFLLIYLGGLYGNFSQYPLRWSEAFFSSNQFLSHLALNPILYFVETYSFSKKDSFNLEKTKEDYLEMSEYLGVTEPSTTPLNFAREVTPSEPAHPFNVIVIVMESMAMSKTNLMNNPLNPTPALEALAKESYYFSNYYSPAEGTARNMFSIMTAIPDVTRIKTSSRNPLVVDQRLIISAFKDHRKMYLLGGSASWANIRGIFSNNIEGIEMYEEDTFNKGRSDIWGLSDLDLFIEAHRIFSQVPENKPFFAVIQSASFHRPYTIPADAKKFKSITAQPSNLIEAGFYSVEQFNSMRFSDYSLGYFMELAKKSPYYKNTIFIVTGDHGLPDENGVNVPKGSHHWALEKYHVPLIIHNPELFPAGVVDKKPGSHLDIMTTAASLAGVPHVNTTMGRSLFNPQFDNERYSFIYNYYSEIGEYYLVNNEFYYRYDDVQKGQLFKYMTDDFEKDVKGEYPEVFERMSKIADGYLQTSRYQLFNNKKPAKP